MKIIKLWLCSLVIYVNSPAYSQPLEVLVTNFPPMIDFSTPNGGIAWVMLEEFARENNLTFEPVVLPSARLLNRVSRGEWQATLIALPESYEGALSVVYSDKTVTYGVVTRLEGDVSLDGMIIATLRSGGVGLNHFEKILTDQGARIFEVNTLEQAYLMAESARVDAVLGIDLNGALIGVPDARGFRMVYPLAVIPFNLYLNRNSENGLATYDRLQRRAE